MTGRRRLVRTGRDGPVVQVVSAERGVAFLCGVRLPDGHVWIVIVPTVEHLTAQEGEIR